MKETWKSKAACRTVDPNLFFPGQWDMESMQAAKAVCAICPVRAECLEYGLHEEQGVWGGTSERERRRIRTARRKAGEREERRPRAARVGV